jgi:hypothetical protein
MAQIQEDYGRIAAQAGQAQFQIASMQKDLERFNQAMSNLNAEAQARQQLDKTAAEAAPSPETQSTPPPVASSETQTQSSVQ